MTFWALLVLIGLHERRVRVIKEEADIIFREQFHYEDDGSEKVITEDRRLVFMRKDNVSTSYKREFTVDSDEDEFDAQEIIGLSNNYPPNLLR
jgi:hypothetical protein